MIVLDRFSAPSLGSFFKYLSLLGFVLQFLHHLSHGIRNLNTQIIDILQTALTDLDEFADSHQSMKSGKPDIASVYVTYPSSDIIHVPITSKGGKISNDVYKATYFAFVSTYNRKSLTLSVNLFPYSCSLKFSLMDYFCKILKLKKIGSCSFAKFFCGYNLEFMFLIGVWTDAISRFKLFLTVSYGKMQLHISETLSHRTMIFFNELG